MQRSWYFHLISIGLFEDFQNLQGIWSHPLALEQKRSKKLEDVDDSDDDDDENDDSNDIASPNDTNKNESTFDDSDDDGIKSSTDGEINSENSGMSIGKYF